MGKHILTVSLLLFLFKNGNAQNNSVVSNIDENKAFEKVEIEATTDIKKWRDHIRKSTVLPDSISKDIPPGTYKVTVQFIVDKHGYIGQLKSMNDPGYGLAKRAIKIIANYPGEWKPASQCGRNVTAYKKQDIYFIVSPNDMTTSH